MSQKFLELLKKTASTLNEDSDFGFDETEGEQPAPETQSALPTENSVELTAEKRVQLVKLAIQCLFIDKSKLSDNSVVNNLTKSPIDLTNVEQKEKELTELLGSLNLPE